MTTSPSGKTNARRWRTRLAEFALRLIACPIAVPRQRIEASVAVVAVAALGPAVPSHATSCHLQASKNTANIESSLHPQRLMSAPALIRLHKNSLQTNTRPKLCARLPVQLHACALTQDTYTPRRQHACTHTHTSACRPSQAHISSNKPPRQNTMTPGTYTRHLDTRMPLPLAPHLHHTYTDKHATSCMISLSPVSPSPSLSGPPLTHMLSSTTMATNHPQTLCCNDSCGKIPSVHRTENVRCKKTDQQTTQRLHSNHHMIRCSQPDATPDHAWPREHALPWLPVRASWATQWIRRPRPPTASRAGVPHAQLPRR